MSIPSWNLRRTLRLTARRLRLSLTSSVASVGFVAPLALGAYLAWHYGRSLGPGLRPLVLAVAWYLALVWVCLGPLLRAFGWSKRAWLPVLGACLVAFMFERPASRWHVAIAASMLVPLFLTWWSCAACRRPLAIRSLSGRGEKVVKVVTDSNDNTSTVETEQTRHLAVCTHCAHVEERVVTLAVEAMLLLVPISGAIYAWIAFGVAVGLTVTISIILAVIVYWLRRRLVPLA